MKFYTISSRRLPCARSRMLKIMRLTCLLLLTALLQVSAASIAQPITLSEEGAPMEKVLKEIRRQSGYDFFYNAALLRKARPVSVHVRNVSLEEALRQSFAGQPLGYTIEHKTVVVKEVEKPQPAKAAPPIDVTGRVVDENGQPLPGATVQVKGTSKGTATNVQGVFLLVNVADDAVLEISFLGYLKKEMKVAPDLGSIQLEVNASKLEEVVVVGYGTQKKVNLTGSVSVVTASDLEARPVVNATQSLQGLVPGLNVNVGGNTKPGQSYNLNIRGMGNISGGDNPYVLVDGLEMSLADVNPNDIESISVLKDASASAIYGSRAAYGVILVTTKKGSAEKTTLSYSNNVGLTTPVRLPEMANSLEFANYFNAATFNALGTRQYSEEKLKLLEQYINNPEGMSIFPEVNSNTYANWENSSNGVANTNWFALHYKPYALKQSHNVSMSGGNKATQYFVSGGYYAEGGNLRYADIDYDRYNLNATVASQILSWAKLRANTKYTRSKSTSPFSGFENMFFHNLARMRPNVSPYDLNGNWSEQSMVPYLQSGSEAREDNTSLAILTGLELEPIKAWKITIDLNLRESSTEQTNLKLPGTIYGINGTPITVNRSEYNIPLKGSYGRNMLNSRYISPNVYSSYSLSIGEGHGLDILVGFQQELNEFKSLSATAQDLISNSRPGISLVTGNQVINESRTHWATRGGFGRLSYNYRSKYLLELNGRYDGSSRFAADSRWGFFPSVSAGYNVDQEKFFAENLPWLSQLKIRGSYGFLGNQSGAGLYAYAENMGITVPGIGSGGRWFYGNGREAYITVPGTFNPFITWEKVENANLGVDFAFFNNQLAGSFDVYQRNTRDMLGPSLDIADLYGATPPLSNNADLRTRGWELTLNWRGQISDQISFTLGGFLADNKSVVTKYQNPNNNDPGGSWYVGKEAGEIWGYRSPGLVQTAEDADAFNGLDHSFLSAQPWKPGDVLYKDLNGDGKINRGANSLGDMGDLAIIGNSSPRYSYSVNGSVTWNRLSMSMLWQGIAKRDFAPNTADAYFWGSGSLAQVTVFKQHLDYWSPENPGAYYPNPYASPVGSINSYIGKTQQVSDRYLQDASYLRLKNVTLSYSLPDQWVQKVRMSRASVFLSGENLLTLTRLAKMFDPETLVGGAAPGKIYPLNKVYAFGLNISF